jgi:hypothetical protein
MSEIPPVVFEQRLQGIVRIMSERHLPAVVVYSELWRSNSARFLSNFMPYFNRALLVVSSEQVVTLFCGLSPRVYGWIRSVTTIEDVRPAGNFARPLFELAAEQGWTRIGVLDFTQFPYDLHRLIQAGPLEIVPIDDAWWIDDTELFMRRKAVSLAREILAAELPFGVGRSDHEFVGRLERRFRRAGAEDLITLLTNGDGAPAPATGQILAPKFSVSLALEYRGHWVRIARPHDFECESQWLLQEDTPAWLENLSGSYPYESISRKNLRAGSVFAVHISRPAGPGKVFYGDTCWYGASGPEVL